MNSFSICDCPISFILKLCKSYYKLGWFIGSGGAIFIKINHFIYITPSGLPKDCLKNSDIFCINEKSLNDLSFIKENSFGVKISQCTNVFLTIYKLREVEGIIHSHDFNSMFITMLIKDDEFRINNQEMIKGIKLGSSNQNYCNTDTLIVPIIENKLFEKDLVISIQSVLEQYPNTNAVLVRNHGVFIWGKNWIETKIMSECYHYLFKTGVKMLNANLKLVN